MENNHFLVKRAVVFPQRKTLQDLENCSYDEKLGWWKWQNQNVCMVKSQHPDKPKPTTKKNDIETGEDRKGE